MFKIKIIKDDKVFRDRAVYNSYIEYYEKGKKIWTQEVVQNMLHEKDARELAEKDIETLKLQNKI
jgi:hypothetical protein